MKNFFNILVLKRSFDRIRGTPQLWLTVIVALAIFSSFLYIANRFADIARDAQDRLVNVRVGSLQDGFAPIVAIFINEPEELFSYIEDLTDQNPTITEFSVLSNVDGRWVVKTSLDKKSVGSEYQGQKFLLSLAVADYKNSFTIEEVVGEERYFRTARAVLGNSGDIVAVLLTRQTLSEADRQISQSIKSSFLILFLILLALFALFFHHAKIIDYTELYKRLKEVDQLKDDFVSMVSHELRAPLTIIRGYVAEIIEGAEESRKSEILKRIDQSAKTLNFLVSDILDVARLEQGKLSFNREKIDPSETLLDLSEEFKSSAKAKGLNFSTKISSGAEIYIDKERLHQVVTNLLSNAVKYSDKGDIVLIAGVDGSRYILRVDDNGIGMNAEEQKRLFEKFYRVSDDRVRKETGTGLGLWITRQIIEKMDGSISVESIKGVGSHFTVSFPLS